MEQMREADQAKPSCHRIKDAEADCVCAKAGRSPQQLNPLLNKAINMKRAAHLY